MKTYTSMNSVYVYCELEGTKVAEVSQELLTKGRKLANTLGVQLEAIAAGSGITGKTTLFVTGESVGPSKLAKAENLGIRRLSEADFFAAYPALKEGGQSGGL